MQRPFLSFSSCRANTCYTQQGGATLREHGETTCKNALFSNLTNVTACETACTLYLCCCIIQSAVDARRPSSKEIPLKGLTAVRRAKSSFLFSDAGVNKQGFSNLGDSVTFQTLFFFFFSTTSTCFLNDYSQMHIFLCLCQDVYPRLEILLVHVQLHPTTDNEKTVKKIALSGTSKFISTAGYYYDE